MDMPMNIIVRRVYENGTNIFKFTTSLSVCISLRYCLAFIVECLGFQSLPNFLWHILEWVQNSAFGYFGYHCLLSGLLVHKSCLASKNKIAASDPSSSNTTILWDLWSHLHLTSFSTVHFWVFNISKYSCQWSWQFVCHHYNIIVSIFGH